MYAILHRYTSQYQQKIESSMNNNQLIINRGQLHRWISALALITFDVDEGQKLQYLIPELQLSPESMKEAAMLSFPDSNSFNDYQNSFKYTFRMYNGMYGYACFKQKKDPKNARGFSQKSFVILSQMPFIHLFQKLCEFIVFKTFNTVPDEEFSSVMSRICEQIAKWPDPTPKTTYILPILDYQLTLEIPNYIYSQDRSHSKFLQTAHERKVELELKESNKQFNLKNILTQEQLLREGPFQQIKLNQIFMNCSEALWAIWEKVMLNKSILLFGTSPQIISHAVLGSISLIYPFEYSGNFNPYVTVYDPHLNKISTEDRNWVLGGTNPLFSKFFSKDKTQIIALDKSFKCPKHLKPLKQLLLKSSTEEQQAINQSAIRKYFYQLSRSVMMIIDDHLKQQPNDLKFFNQANFIKEIKDRKELFGFDQVFSSRKYAVEFLKEFVISSNFEAYLAKKNAIKAKSK